LETLSGGCRPGKRDGSLVRPDRANSLSCDAIENVKLAGHWPHCQPIARRDGAGKLHHQGLVARLMTLGHAAVHDGF
jgi:hypothetical protein